VLQPTPRAQRHWNQWLQHRMERTVWTTGGCRSWYLTEDGKNTTLWPGSTSAFRRATRRIDLTEYELIKRQPAAAAAPTAQEVSA
jgi:hypothetical protein